MQRKATGVLLLVVLVAITVVANPAAWAANPPHHHARPARPRGNGYSVIVRRRGLRPGTYRVSVAIAIARRTRRERVYLQVGRRAHRAIFIGRRHRARITLRIRVVGHKLVLRAVGNRSRPQIVGVRLRGFRRPVRHRPPPARPPSSGTTGATGVTAVPPAPTAAALPATQPVATFGPPGPASSWQLAFDDEFSGSSLDTSLWSVGWFGSGITKPVNTAEDACYDPANVSESGGELDLALAAKSETCGGATEPYAGALVSTNGHFSFTYGFIEVRAWLAGSGTTMYDWPQIWTDGQSWPSDGEIDLLEGLQGAACYHWHGPPSGIGYGVCPSGSFTGGWHTFGVDWEPGIVTFYYDGFNVGSITSATSAITANPMYLILVASASSSSVVQAPAVERFDYVRVWEH